MNPKIEKLSKMFAKLPRVGGRGGLRIALSLLQDKTGKAEMLSATLAQIASEIRPCEICGCLTDSEVCEFCRDVSRDNGIVCIVRDMGDVYTLEKSGAYSGRYHIIGGLISGAAGMGPEDLNIESLVIRENITEIIFALPNTVEGKTTQHYIKSKFEQRTTSNEQPVTFSELAVGVPIGGDLDYMDEGTLSVALAGRKSI